MNSSRDQHRRLIIRAGAGALGASLLPALAQPAGKAIRIGTTPVFLDDQLGFLEAWKLDLQARLQYPVTFVQRKSYREVTELLLDGVLDCAWLCGYPYVRFHDRLQLVVVPSFNGAPLYQSYMIVPADAPAPASLLDMRDRSFAFSDPLSNSGFLVPRHVLFAGGVDPDRHFGRTLFTWSHRKVVEAVAIGLVAGGAVDGYVWETLAKEYPALAEKTRVAWKSRTFGFPPIVASRKASPELTQSLRAAFLGMAGDAQGRQLLAQLNLSGFVTAKDRLFEPIERMMQDLASAGKLQ